MAGPQASPNVAATLAFRAVTRDIRRQADSSGTLVVQFSRSAANEPKCSGLEVFGSAPVSQPPILSASALTNTVAILAWQATAGAIYQLESKDSLTASNWTACGNPLITSGSPVPLTNSIAGAPGCFYRIVMVNSSRRANGSFFAPGS